LVRNQHRGPLLVQKSLYPEGAGVAHTLMLHPPGGLAGGDELAIDLTLASGSEVLATTPGATKWYHGERGSAAQSIRLTLAADACLEWLPQEAILFERADARQSLHVDLHPLSRMFGWDIVQLGRVAAAEPWLQGRWRQRLQLLRDGRERWREQVELAADDPLRNSPLGLAGHPVLATAWATAPALRDGGDDLMTPLRNCAAQFPVACGISWLPAPSELLMIRVLGADCAPVRALLEALWMRLRPLVNGRTASKPRIWDT
jgi:urease accessory protein